MRITSARFIRSVVGSHNVLVDEKPQIAFVGRSNVGKSSLINMLVGQKQLVRSSATPGKTQEINFFLVNDAYYFVDLPGYGYATLSQKRREKLRKLILWYFISGEAPVTKVVIIIDAKVGLREFDEEMIAVLQEQGIPFIIAVNKVDKLNQKKLYAVLQQLYTVVAEEAVFPVSAKTGKGREKLLSAIMQKS